LAVVGLLALLDDIATVLDDVAVMSKIAAKKTAAVLGDDLALNAQQVTGVAAERELPVVWAVAKGSFKNKLILVPAALLISVVAPWLIVPALMMGGGYLCFEGFEKVYHSLFQKKQVETEHAKLHEALINTEVDLVELEKKKIKGAIRTDFILSAEIIVITLGTSPDASFLTQVIVVSLIAALMTVGVYSLVAGIVKLDDAGLYLMRLEGEGLWLRFKRSTGELMLSFCPHLMKWLSILGTVAMFLVGGGILVHGIAPLHHFFDYSAELSSGLPAIGAVVSALVPTLLNGLVGLVAGGALVLVVTLFNRLRGVSSVQH
jgi:predicted DNA repair protein MutK